jgi:prepilin-type N-terminal cleavage/methylation domain-containing protein
MKSKVSENMPIQQKGYTIVELAIAVTIIGVLIVAGLSGVSSLLVSSKANTQIEESGKRYGLISSQSCSEQRRYNRHGRWQRVCQKQLHSHASPNKRVSSCCRRRRYLHPDKYSQGSLRGHCCQLGQPVQCCLGLQRNPPLKISQGIPPI